MKSIANLIKKKGRNLLILNIILFALLGIYTYYIMTEDRTYSDLFKGTCEVHNMDDLEHCFNNNYYVRIHFDDVYSTNYGYYVDDVIKAYYIDLDLEGYSFITLVEESVANELFSDNNSITYIDGVITYFDEKEEHDGVIEGIKADYLSDFGEEFTAEDIDNMIIPIQMNAYQNPKNTNMVLLVILIGLGITTIIFMIKGLLMIIKPNEYKAFKKIENQDNLENEFENKIVYESKSIYLLPNYIIKENGFNIKIKEKKDLVWVYQRISKKYGVTVSKCYNLNFRDGDNFDININDENVLNEFKQNLLIGYTSENQKEYRKIVNEAKREN